MEDKTNFFYHTTKEISHSAFWAWIFECAKDAFEKPEHNLFNEQKLLVNEIYQKLGLPNNCKIKEVKKEYVPLIMGAADSKRKKLRFDIFIELVDDKGNILIENKVSAIPNNEQLKEYEEVARPNAKRILLIANYDFDFPVNGNWKKFNLNEIQSIFNKIGHIDNYLLRQYKFWIDNKVSEINKIEEIVNNNDLNNFNNQENGREEIAQWLLFKQMFYKDNINDFNHGHNKDGTSYVEYNFFPPQDSNVNPQYQEWLYWRIDKTSNNSYVTLRQNLKPSPTMDQNERMIIINKRKANLKDLKTVFEIIRNKLLASEGKIDLHFARIRSENKDGGTICKLIVDSNNNSIEMLKTYVPILHKSFVNELKCNGWPIKCD
jgi:hypothetical protein